MKTQKWLHCDVIHKKFNNCYNWNQKIIPGRLLHAKFYVSGVKNKQIRRGGGRGEGVKYAPKVLSVFNLKAQVGQG